MVAKMLEHGDSINFTHDIFVCLFLFFIQFWIPYYISHAAIKTMVTGDADPLPGVGVCVWSNSTSTEVSAGNVDEGDPVLHLIAPVVLVLPEWWLKHWEQFTPYVGVQVEVLHVL